MSAATEGAALLVHGTAIAVGQYAVLLRGAPGAGKSDLALRLISSPPAGLLLPGLPRLVTDDQCLLSREEGRIIVKPPPAIAGLLEVRGLGLIKVPFSAGSELRLVIDLVAREEVERMPESGQAERYFDVPIPVARLYAYDSSCPIKVLLALADATAANYI